MKCSEVQKKIIFYIEKELKKTSSSEIESHLNQCMKCNFIFNEMNKTYSILNDVKQLNPNPFFYTRLNEKIKEIENKENKIIFRPSFVRIFQPIAVSFILIISLVLGIVIGNEFNENSNTFENTIAFDSQVYSDNFYLNEIEGEYFENFLINGKNE
ncbi:MAG: zf-HC2 domain-containing protein [Bacteroidales bacterium]|nr:zf-HC2 domain-containing protein [Bacteroidales bacterium]